MSEIKGCRRGGGRGALVTSIRGQGVVGAVGTMCHLTGMGVAGQQWLLCSNLCATFLPRLSLLLPTFSRAGGYLDFQVRHPNFKILTVTSSIKNMIGQYAGCCWFHFSVSHLEAPKVSSSFNILSFVFH